MKILLIYPEFPDTFWSFKHALKFVKKKAGAPPLGLLTVAAMLPSEWEKRLVDLNITDLTDEDLAWADQLVLPSFAYAAARDPLDPVAPVVERPVGSPQLGEHAAHRARQTAVPAEDHGTSDVFDDLFVGGSEYSPGGAE